jgi:hypothetical protein
MAARSSLRSVAVVLGLTLLAAIVTPAAAAHAAAGVGVGAAPIEAKGELTAASSVVLPSLYVMNTGTEPSTYGIRVQRIGKTSGTPVPTSWVTVTPATLALKPKAGRWVKVSLQIPAGAASGSYTSYLVAGTLAGGQATGTKAQFGAQAATQLSFKVGAPGSAAAVESKPDTSSNGADLGPWWAWVGGLALVVAVIAIWKSGIRVKVTRS